MEPLNSNDVVFSLDFINGLEGRFTIDEPVNFDGLNFFLKQEDDRYGRDVSFASGEFALRFDKKSNQNASQLPLLLTYNQTYGFESIVNFIITIYGVDYVIGVLDFQRAITDGLTYFECFIIQESNQALIKRRSDIKVDLFSDVDLDGNAIVPLSTNNMFLGATAINQASGWLAVSEFTDSAFGNITWNHINAIQTSDIEDTLSFAVLFNADPEFLRYIEAQNDLADVVMELSSFTMTQNDFSFTTLNYRIGVDFSSATEVELEDFSNGDFVDFSNTYNLPGIRRGETLWVYFRSITGVESPSVTAQSGAIVDISVNATPISTVTPVVTLQDLISQVILSTTGMAVTFSDDFNTTTEDERCFNGLSLRGFAPENFYVSFDDIKSWFEEINADFQIVDNDNIFVGLYSDFYDDFIVGSNTIAPNAEFKRTYNPRYTINKFNYKYSKFEDDKNTENNRALFAIHTESQWNIPNLQVENKKEIDIEFIRDAFLIETVRRFNIQVNNSESTKNDEDIFIVDTNPILVNPDNNYNFGSFVSVDGNFVTFTNNNDFSFIATGLEIAKVVTFTANGFTASGTVTSLSETVVTIDDGGASGIVNGQYVVNFDFNVTAEFASTNDKFVFVDNDGSGGDGFVNIFYSPKRNILNYWGSYLNTACSFSQGGTIRNTFFKGNADLRSFRLADGLGVIVEGDDILVSALNDRLLTPYIIETVIIVDFTEFQAIVANIRAERGYLEIADNNGNVVEVYPQILDYNWEQNALRVVGEERI